MKTQAGFSTEHGIGDVANRIVATGKITREDEQMLHQVMMSDLYLGMEDLRHIRIVLDRLQMGLLRVAD
ncbi:hypothetical protein HPC62_21925 [Thermoleptolyngbya sichuanensis A183]|uniref:Uncharacterized protein n=1 Tax=Thermoleptolyngbya sichuanensis A183 TaxID=2737172 RepID=A0A6M8BJV6_9CYAN|nr:MULTISPECIES: hypothetical protein [Thermoleptolyngbya]QKD84490.1 hypothetical protein HPC62_21925 [Thermoleptolyngbya sichuanensis A183]